MIIAHRQQLAFTHIPKNAGTSIRHWLMRHVETAREVQDHDGEVIKHCPPTHLYRVGQRSLRFFAVVRNPYDRLLSHYHFHKTRYTQYMAQNSKIRHKAEIQERYRDLMRGFGHWLTHPHTIADRDAKWYDYRWCTQSTWINDRTHVLRYENLAEDFQWVQEQFGVSEPLDSHNVTGVDTDHRTKLNLQELKPHLALIRKHLEADFHKFGYRFITP